MMKCPSRSKAAAGAADARTPAAAAIVTSMRRRTFIRPLGSCCPYLRCSHGGVDEPMTESRSPMGPLALVDSDPDASLQRGGARHENSKSETSGDSGSADGRARVRGL